MIPQLVPPLAAVLLISSAPATAQRVHDIVRVARPAPAQIEPGRTVTNAWLYDGQLPGPTVRVTEGDTVRFTLRNELPEPTTVHWHGLPVPARADGVPGVTQGAIGVGQSYTYEFVADRPGTYWYHPHLDLQIDRGLVAPLIVEPRDPRADPPFDREHLIVLDDWLPGDPVAGRDPAYSDWLINGRTSLGQVPLTVQRGEVVRLRILNASGATNYAVAVDGHAMLVTHADGQPVVPVTAAVLPIGAGERWDVYLTANNPGRWSIAATDLRDRGRTLVRAVLAYAGSTGPDPSPTHVPAALAGGALLSYAQLASARPGGGIASRPDRTLPIALGWFGMMRYVWTINGQAFPNADPLDVRRGETVRLETTNLTMHDHPMHVHGHFFRLLGSGGGTTAPLVKDTVLVPRGSMMLPSRLDMELVAANPGAWAYHCHMIYHMAAGMMRLLRYTGTDADGDGLADGEDMDPEGPHPVVWTEDRGGTYRPGAAVGLLAQWLPGATLHWFAGPELSRPLALGALGTLAIDPLLPLGAAPAGPTRIAELPLRIPADPALAGARLGLQAVGSHPALPPGFRLSPAATLTIR